MDGIVPDHQEVRATTGFEEQQISAFFVYNSQSFILLAFIAAVVYGLLRLI
jgi:hypothetical protein